MNALRKIVKESIDKMFLLLELYTKEYIIVILLLDPFLFIVLGININHPS